MVGIDKGLENYSTNVRFYPESPCQPDDVSKQWDDMKRFPFSMIIASRAVEERGWKQEDWWVMSGTKKEAKVVVMGVEKSVQTEGYFQGRRDKAWMWE